MVTSYLVRARDCAAIDPKRISEAGGQLIGVGCLEDDGTVKVDVDITDRDADRRLSKLFAQHS